MSKKNNKENTMKLTKEEALAKIEELKKYVADEEKPKGVVIYKTDGSVLFESSKDTLKEVVLEKYARDANLCDANLLGADLRGADLRGANLCGADLRGADLRDADLYDADLHIAYLYDADLCDANLRGAELASAKFYGKGGGQKLKRSQLPDFLAALGFVIEED